MKMKVNEVLYDKGLLTIDPYLSISIYVHNKLNQICWFKDFDGARKYLNPHLLEAEVDIINLENNCEIVLIITSEELNKVFNLINKDWKERK